MERLYVAQGATGLLKIGRSKRPEVRKVTLVKEFARRDDVIARFGFCDAIEQASGVEWSLQMRMGKVFGRESGREWFIDGNFDVAFECASQLTAEQVKRDEFNRSPAGVRKKKREAIALRDQLATMEAERTESNKRRQAAIALTNSRRRGRQIRKLGPIAMVVSYLTAA